MPTVKRVDSTEMLICREEARAELLARRDATPFPNLEPFSDREIIKEGWLYGSTFGFQPIDEVASELDRLFGRDDFSAILKDPDRRNERFDPDVFREGARSYMLGGFLTMMFFVHPSKVDLLPGYTSIMSFERVR